jgi:hypothetical protein
VTTARSVHAATDFAKCFLHEDEDCPRCDGSGSRPRLVCASCGEPAKRLSPRRTSKSREEARGLPQYCVHCNPRFRDLDAVWSGLERMGG